MAGRTDILFILALITSTLLLAGCATVRMHSEAELNQVSRACGLAMGELVQEEDLKKMLFVFRVAPSAEQRRCAQAWARKNHMKVTIIEAVTRTPS